jgi:predicted small secreted protein
MRKLFKSLFIFFLGYTLTACNTMKGIGKDVERGGEKVQDAATGAQKGSK